MNHGVDLVAHTNRLVTISLEKWKSVEWEVFRLFTSSSIKYLEIQFDSDCNLGIVQLFVELHFAFEEG